MYLPPNSTSGDNNPPEELLLVIEAPVASLSLVSIDGVLPIVLKIGRRKLLYLHVIPYRIHKYILYTSNNIIISILIVYNIYFIQYIYNIYCIQLKYLF